MRVINPKIAASFAGVLIVAVLSYIFIDIPVAFFCKSLDKSITDFFGIVTEFGISTWYLVGFLALFLIFRFLYPQRIYAHRALFLFVSVAVSGIVTNIIKMIIGRYRPEMLFEKGLYGFEFFQIDSTLVSFPSGHATTAFSLAYALSLFSFKFRVPLFCFALAVGASRVIITAHYFSDVVVGAYIGIMSVLGLRKLMWLE
ncbi:MAG: phosphatase PAP2 family protein [Deltaproteobacteria bacterium]|nr:phosphatase PAP2 family protein [Deltaproteobacteria bacterium]